MSKSKKIPFDRKTMRRFAVNCVFAYEFELKARRAAESEQKERPEKIKRATDTVSISKKIGNGVRRRTTMTRLEYDEKYKEILETVRNEAPESGDDPGMGVFSTEEFIQEVLGAKFEDEGRDTVVFADLPDYKEYLYPVVDGVVRNIDEIDAAISANLHNWSMDRINKEDLAVLRVAVFEILHFSDTVPLQIAINEAVEIAKEKDPKCGMFVNGVLAGVAKGLNGNG